VRGEVAGVTPTVRKKLASFVDVIDGLAAVRDAGASVAEQVIQVVERSGLREKLEAEGTPEARERLDNLAALVNMASDFDDELGSEGTLDLFLERTALVAGADDDDRGEVVRLMTVHIAKGLEFPYVFLCGLEDGLFPSLRERDGASEAEALEEERRLAYVAITRARDKLVMTAARTRRVWGEIRIQAASRFIEDIPPSCLALPVRPPAPRPTPMLVAPRPAGRPQRPSRGFGRGSWDEHDQRSGDDDVPVYDVHADLRPSDGFAVGAEVSHAAFGTGRVVEARGSGKDTRLTVDFPSVGRKVVLARFLARS